MPGTVLAPGIQEPTTQTEVPALRDLVSLGKDEERSLDQ